MKCSACGRENRKVAAFCAWCGAAFTGAAGAQPQAEPDASVQAAATGATAEAQPPPTATATEPVAAPSPSAAAPTTEQEPTAAEAEPAASGSDSAPAEGQEAAEEPQPAATGPRKPGEVLGERFEIVELLESAPEGDSYRVKDLRRCPACGYGDNPAAGRYCHECGAALGAPVYATLVEQVHRTPDRFDLHFAQGQRDYYVTLDPVAPAAKPAESAPFPALRLVWGRATDRGQKRDHNEDYLEAWLYARGSGSALGLFVVADGLGGQDSGEVASRMTTDLLWQALRASIWEPIVRGEGHDPTGVEEKLKAAILQANQGIYEERLARSSMMSSTLTVALVVENTAYVANVGDSRTYLWNAQGLRQITTDHSLVQRLVETGQIGPEEIYTHPQRNLIYQSMGDRPEVRPDIYRQGLVPDDHLILCSDGLWEMVRNEGLEEVLLAEPDPQRACERLVRDANLAGGEDNISVIIVQALGA